MSSRGHELQSRSPRASDHGALTLMLLKEKNDSATYQFEVSVICHAEATYAGSGRNDMGLT